MVILLRSFGANYDVCHNVERPIRDEEAKEETNKSMVCDKSSGSAPMISYLGQNKEDGKSFTKGRL